MPGLRCGRGGSAGLGRARQLSASAFSGSGAGGDGVAEQPRRKPRPAFHLPAQVGLISATHRGGSGAKGEFRQGDETLKTTDGSEAPGTQADLVFEESAKLPWTDAQSLGDAFDLRPGALQQCGGFPEPGRRRNEFGFDIVEGAPCFGPRKLRAGNNRIDEFLGAHPQEPPGLPWGKAKARGGTREGDPPGTFHRPDDPEAIVAMNDVDAAVRKNVQTGMGRRALPRRRTLNGNITGHHFVGRCRHRCQT